MVKADTPEAFLEPLSVIILIPVSQPGNAWQPQHRAFGGGLYMGMGLLLPQLAWQLAQERGQLLWRADDDFWISPQPF